jgi:hypothetical protein
METQLLSMYLMMLVVGFIGLSTGALAGLILLRHTNEVQVLVAFVLMLAVWGVSQLAHVALGAFEASSYTIALIVGFLLGGIYRLIDRNDSVAK